MSQSYECEVFFRLASFGNSVSASGIARATSEHGEADVGRAAAARKRPRGAATSAAGLSKTGWLTLARGLAWSWGGGFGGEGFGGEGFGEGCQEGRGFVGGFWGGLSGGLGVCGKVSGRVVRRVGFDRGLEGARFFLRFWCVLGRVRGGFLERFWSVFGAFFGAVRGGLLGAFFLRFTV